MKFAQSFVLSVSAVTLFATVAHAQVAIPGVTKNAGCEQVTLESKTATCDADKCILEGEALIACEAMRLWADRIGAQSIKRSPFRRRHCHGQRAVGRRQQTRHLRTRDGAGRSHSGAYRRGRNQDQTRRRGAARHEDPGCRDQAVFSGRTIHRLAEDYLSIDDAAFTLCDCGDNSRPSWEMRAGRIDAKLGDRVTVYWPSIRVNPFGLGVLVPITPPLAPISLPLKSRAPGFLPPRIQLLRGLSWPAIDLPFFVPLGRSWDLTVIPGLRMDWTPDRSLTSVSGWEPRNWAPVCAMRRPTAPMAS